MITYTKTETKKYPKLQIWSDADCESPRTWSNLGTFITKTRNYNSPDKDVEFLELFENAYNSEGVNTAEQHLKMFKKLLKENGNKIKYVCLITKHEHGNVYYKRGAVQGWDSGVCGAYIVLVNEETKKYTNKKIEAIIDGELENYNSWCNGDVWGYTLYSDDGEVEDSCGGFFSSESVEDEIKATHPEFKNENLSEYYKDY